MKGFRYPGVGIALIVTLVVWLLSEAGLFVLPEGIIYDRLVQYSLATEVSSSQVLLVSADFRKLNVGDDYWLSLLNKLQSQAPAQVIFTFLPDGVTPAFYAAAQRQGNVLFGRAVERDEGKSDGLVLQALPDAAAGTNLVWGIVGAGPVSYGVHRQQYASFTVDDHSFPTLEVAALNAAGKAYEIAEPYLVNFLMGADRIPIVSAQRVLSDGVIADMVGGKHILIGFSDDLFLQDIHTPVTGGSRRMPLLEFQGYTLQTLLQQRIPMQSGSLVNLLLIALVASFCVFIYQWMGLRLASWVLLVLTMFHVILAWLILPWFLLWLPVVEILTIQMLMFGFIYRHRAVREEQGLRRMVLKNTSKLNLRLANNNFYSSTEHWAQVINLVNQTLDLKRLIFLERVTGDHRLREIRSLNCSLDSIVEQRRDYERTPYSTAIAASGPIRLERPYLQEDFEGEEQYLVPLLFAGDVLGFWAFGIDPNKVASTPMFIQRVRDYAQQIAELLYHRQHWLSQRQTESGTLKRYLEIESEGAIYKALSRASELLGRRNKSLEQVFDGLGTATVLYDLFGGLVQINKRMTELLQRANLPVYDMTALDLMMAVTEMDSTRARNSLRYIILERGTIAVPAVLNGVDDQVLVLNARALLHSDEADQNDTNPAPFQLLGVLFELIDVTHFKRLFQLKEQLIDRLNIQIRNDMDSVLLAVGMLRDENLPSEQHQRVLTIVEKKIAQSAQVMVEAQQYLDADMASGLLECYPIEITSLAATGVDAVADKASERKVKIETDLSVLVGLVFGEPMMLTDIIKTLLTVLIDDAVEESVVNLVIRQEENRVVLEFHNTGFGIPNERLQGYLFGDGELVIEEFKKLRGSMVAIGKWGGELDAVSEVGEGMRFTLRMRGFL